MGKKLTQETKIEMVRRYNDDEKFKSIRGYLNEN
jgi:hypothetical protein